MKNFVYIKMSYGMENEGSSSWNLNGKDEKSRRSTPTTDYVVLR